MKRQFFLCSVIFICLAACRKDYPVDNPTASPVFYFKGVVNGSPVNINAGIDNYYMYSSFIQDSNDVYNFFGEFRQTVCTNCTNKIKFQINDQASTAPNSPSLINVSLVSGYYAIQQVDSIQIGTPTEYMVSFSPDDNDSTALYIWDFGDGTTSQLFAPTHLFDHPGYYNVCLTVNYSGCTNSICNQIKVGIAEPSCDVYIVDSLISANTVLLTASANGMSGMYSWDFGDGTTSISNLNTITHTYTIPGAYTVCVEATGQNCSSTICRNVSTQNFTGCVANYYSYIQGISQNPFSLSNIIVEWTDNSGAIYTSNMAAQSIDSYFQIISVEDYLANENGEPTKKLHIRFKCDLFNGNDVISIDNAEAIIAVSYR